MDKNTLKTFKITSIIIIFTGVIYYALNEGDDNIYENIPSNSEFENRLFDKSVEEQTTKAESEIEYFVDEPQPNEISVNEEVFEKQNIFYGKKIFVFSSDNCAIQMPNGETFERRIRTYHTFNLKNKSVTVNSILNRKSVELIYDFKSIYEDDDIMGINYVLNMSSPIVKEISLTPSIPDIIYVHYDGTILRYYNLKIKIK